PSVDTSGPAAAVDYLGARGMGAGRAQGKSLAAYAPRAPEARFEGRPHIHGPPDAERRGGAISFAFDRIHAHDVAQVLDEDGVCVRASHHCAKPLMRVLGVPATTRGALYVYNDENDVDTPVASLARAEKFFAI